MRSPVCACVLTIVVALLVPVHQVWACACDDDEEVVCTAGEEYDPKTHQCVPVPIG